MLMTDLPVGFGLVPLKETDVSHVMSQRRQMARAFRGVDMPVRLPMRQCAYIARTTDVMALQAGMLLRSAMLEMRETSDSDQWEMV